MKRIIRFSIADLVLPFFVRERGITGELYNKRAGSVHGVFVGVVCEENREWKKKIRQDKEMIA